MSLVVDASVIFAVLAKEPIKPALISLTRGEELFAPHSLPWKIGNAFSAMFKRKVIALTQAITAIAEFSRTVITYADVELRRRTRSTSTPMMPICWSAPSNSAIRYSPWIEACSMQPGVPESKSWRSPTDVNVLGRSRVPQFTAGTSRPRRSRPHPTPRRASLRFGAGINTQVAARRAGHRPASRCAANRRVHPCRPTRTTVKSCGRPFRSIQRMSVNFSR